MTEWLGSKGSKRVIRGGSWNSNARNVRSAYRNRNEPDERNDNLGFRLARVQRGCRSALPDQSRVRCSKAFEVSRAEETERVGVPVGRVESRGERSPALAFVETSTEG